MAQAKPVLVPDVSQRDIQIAYSFTGAELLLFGAILYPGGRPPQDDKPTDIVVVVKGPTQSILIREKEKIAGLWVNAGRLRYQSAPSFYAIASSRPITRIVDDRTRAIYELGLDSLQLSPASSAPADVQARFQAGLVDQRRRSGLYVEAPRAVEITDDVLYRARVTIRRACRRAIHRRDLPDPRRPACWRRRCAISTSANRGSSVSSRVPPIAPPSLTAWRRSPCRSCWAGPRAGSPGGSEFAIRILRFGRYR